MPTSKVNQTKPPITAYPLIFLVQLYRLTLSPIFGNYCRFEPTCSRYALDALTKYGALKGSWLAIRRIGRCHPWHPGGYDPAE
ncbi:MAG: membrane protein insertion efficiency factor YidD [Candidatus Zixiibacteriota bacterium]